MREFREYQKENFKKKIEFVYTFSEILKVKGLSLALLLHITSFEGQSLYICTWENFMNVKILN